MLGVCIKWGSQPSLPVRRSAVNAGSQGLSFLANCPSVQLSCLPGPAQLGLHVGGWKE